MKEHTQKNRARKSMTRVNRSRQKQKIWGYKFLKSPVLILENALIGKTIVEYNK